MKEIDLPQAIDQRIKVIQRYFYGSSPSFQIRQGDGRKDYIPYHYHRAGYRKENEPEPIEIIQAHVEGNDTWATRAVQDDRAHFAALDVDTTDTKLLEPLRMRLYDTYAWNYNWEQSESGVHIWFLWEGTIPLDTAIEFIEILQLPPELEDIIDIRYPTKDNSLRLPLPGNYDPTPSFPERDKLVVLTVEDIHEIIGEKPSTRVADASCRECTATADRNWVQVLSGQGVDDSKLYSKYQSQNTNGGFNLEGRVKRFLSTVPTDGHVYETLILENMLANTVAVFGEKEGLAKLRGWIRRGSREHADRRIAELQKYHRQNERKQWKAITGCLCTPEDMEHFRQGMFDDVLGFIDGMKCLGDDLKKEIKCNMERVLFIMLVCAGVAEKHNQRAKARKHKLIPHISTRQLARLMGWDESERRKAGTARAYLTSGGKESKAQSLGVFQIVEQSTNCRSPRFVLNPKFYYLLQRVETALITTPMFPEDSGCQHKAQQEDVEPMPEPAVA